MMMQPVHQNIQISWFLLFSLCEYSYLHAYSALHGYSAQKSTRPLLKPSQVDKLEEERERNDRSGRKKGTGTERVPHFTEISNALIYSSR